MYIETNKSYKAKLVKSIYYKSFSTAIGSLKTDMKYKLSHYFVDYIYFFHKNCLKTYFLNSK